MLRLINGDLDSAIKTLRIAAVRAPRDARIFADLSAAYLERAVTQDNPIDLLYALGTVEQALRNQPSSSTALFNKALILERLHLDMQAARAMSEVLRVEFDAGWRTEAQECLQRIAKRLFRGNQLITYQARLLAAIDSRNWQAARRLIKADSRRGRYAIEEVLLARWGEAASRSDSLIAAHHLAAAAMAAQLYAEVAGDPFLRSVTQAIAAASAGSQAAEAAQSRAHQDYSVARDHLATGRYEEAQVLFSRAEAKLRAARTPFLLRVRQGKATTEYFLGRREAAKQVLVEVRGAAIERGFVALAGESSWMLGLCEFADDDLESALAAYETALNFFQELGEKENIAGAQNLIAETLDRQGAFAAGWRRRDRALQLLSSGSDPLRLYQLYAVAAISAVAIGQPEGALAFQRAAVAKAESLDNPVALAHALTWQARYELRAGNLAHARAAAERAKRASARIADLGARETADVGALLAEAEAAVAQQPLAALELLDEALSSARTADSTYHLVDIHLLRARLRERMAHLDAAVTELDRCIEALEERRTKIHDLARQHLVVDQSRAAFDRAARLQVARLGNACKAFEYVERRRARESADLILALPGGEQRLRGAKSPYGAAWLGCAAVQRSLSARDAMVSYAELEGELYVWLLTRASMRTWRIDGTAPDIRRAIFNLQRAAAGRDDSVGLRHLAVTLGKVLLGPLRLRSTGVDRIIFVVDTPFDGVPYAALVDPSTGTYLSKDHAVVVNPSAVVYAAAARRRETKRLSAWPRVALFGDPDFDQDSLPGLPPLPRSREQTLRNARLYERAALFVGADATPANFLREAGSANILQFAGHAVIRHRAPLWSRMILASRSADPAPGHVTAADIYGLEMREARLVVLAMCGRPAEEESFGAGFVGPFARAFLAAGAPSVVATLWPIEDGEAAEFLLRFHQRLQETPEPARALQSTQTDFSLRPGSNVWAAFQLAGA